MVELIGILIHVVIAVSWSGFVFRVVLLVFWKSGHTGHKLRLFLWKWSWHCEVVMALMILLDDHLKLESLLAHHNAEDDDHNNLEDGSSLERVHPDRVL